MKKGVLSGVFFVLLSAIQVSALPAFFSSGWSPNLVLIFLVFLSWGKSFSQSWRTALVGGFILDIFCFSPPGLNMASLLCVVFLIGSFSKRFSVSGKGGFFLSSFVLMGLSSALNFTLSFLAAKAFGSAQIFPGSVFSNISMLMVEFSKSVFSDIAGFSAAFWPAMKARQVLDLYRRNNFQETRFLK